MSKSKFNYYRIWVENDGGEVVNPRNVFSDDIFSNDLFDISTDQNRYTLRFQEIRSNQYHGIIVRTKDESGYLRLFEGSLDQFSDILEGDGRVGEAKFDHVNSGFVVGEEEIDLMVEVGFQTPGIGVITNYLQQHIDTSLDHEVKHKTRYRQDAEENLDRLLEEELKKIEISFKKSPRVYEELDLADTLKEVAPENYRLKFEVSLDRGKDGEGTGIDDYMSQVSSMLGRGEDRSNPEESLQMIDLPRIMHTFRLTGEENGDVIEENIANMTLQDKIDTSEYDSFDENLGERLCDQILHHQEG